MRMTAAPCASNEVTGRATPAGARPGGYRVAVMSDSRLGVDFVGLFESGNDRLDSPWAHDLERPGAHSTGPRLQHELTEPAHVVGVQVGEQDRLDLPERHVHQLECEGAAGGPSPR